MVIPSTPGAPLFALTLLYALLKLSLYSIASKSFGCVTVSFFPYQIELTLRAFALPFMFRTISLQTATVLSVFCHD